MVKEKYDKFTVKDAQKIYGYYFNSVTKVTQGKKKLVDPPADTQGPPRVPSDAQTSFAEGQFSDQDD